MGIMYSPSIVFSIFLIFTGAALLSTIALYTRQSLLVAYILLGILLGPSVSRLVSDMTIIRQTGEIGIIFLLFLLGLNLHPQNLWEMLGKTSGIALISSILFALFGGLITWFFGYSFTSACVVGACMMFSSTIIGLKLLPTTILHHQHTGEVMISILLLQDIIAIFVLTMIYGFGQGGLTLHEVVMMILGLPGLVILGVLLEKYVLVYLISKFDRIQEYIFLLAVGWCLGMAELANWLGLSTETGAFVAGVVLAASPIALYISECLKPLRDFFLVMFFFSIGAGFDLLYLPDVFIPASILAIGALALKPLIFSVLLKKSGENSSSAWEIGTRLGQISEFSLLVGFIASGANLIDPKTSYLIQAATILTFIVSSYIVVLKYPTPIAFSDSMRRD